MQVTRYMYIHTNHTKTTNPHAIHLRVSSCLAQNSSQGAKQRGSTMTHGYKHSWLSLSHSKDVKTVTQGQLRFNVFVLCIFSWNPAKPCTECYEVRFQRKVLGLSRSTVENVLEMSFEVHWPRLPLKCKKVHKSQPATQPLPEHSKKLPVPRPRPGFHKFHKRGPFCFEDVQSVSQTLKALTAKIAALKTSVVTRFALS